MDLVPQASNTNGDPFCKWVGHWTYDEKRTKSEVNQSVSCQRIMKKAKVSITKRVGFQYFVGNEVSQEISYNKVGGLLIVAAFIKGIPTWSKDLFLDGRKISVVDPLFGKSVANTHYHDPTQVQ